MKITVISRNQNWCNQQLPLAANRLKVSLEIIDFDQVDQAESFSAWGDVVILRNTSLDKIFERPFLAESLDRAGSYVLNRVLIDQPLIIYKSFQQKAVREYVRFSDDTDLKTIPTFKPNSKEELLELVEKGRLRFPLIEKLDLDAKGKSVRKIESIEDISNTVNKIYQSFIPNDGDFRILCLGGRVLGVIKRIAKADDFRNNFSQGGSVVPVGDKAIADKVSKIALKAAAVLGLDFCGIDVIYDRTRDEYFFLEANNYPGWEGFQKVTGVNVADELLKHCIEINRRKKLDNFNLISRYYWGHLEHLRGSKFHFLSRHYLWFGDDKSRKALDKIKKDFIGSCDEDVAYMIEKLLSSEHINAFMNEPRLRIPLFRKYDKLYVYDKVLFKVLFAQKIFGLDIRPIVSRYVKREELIKLKQELEKNNADMAILSTYALNFIYNVEFYLYQDDKTSHFVNPELYYRIAKNGYVGRAKGKNNLQIYFLTHCIINESRFYSRKITRHKESYIKMIKLAEDIIRSDYFGISLDNKLEFLVCARLLGFESALRQVIHSEAQLSLSHSGNYLVDAFNAAAYWKNKASFKESEHRNILFLMAFGSSPRFDGKRKK